MTNEERFQSLYRRYYLRVVRFYTAAFHLTQEEAEDLTQEVFIRVFRAIAEYRGDAEWAFLEQTARHLAYNRIRSLSAIKRKVETVDIDDPNFKHEPAAPPEPDYAEREFQMLRRRRLRDALAELPQGQRQAMQLWLAGHKYEGIAAFLGTTVDSVKSRLRDAKKFLRKRLGDNETLPEVEP